MSDYFISGNGICERKVKMRKTFGTKKRTAVAILAAAMIMSGTGVPAASQNYPYAVSAAENDEQTIDTHTQTDADSEVTQTENDFEEANPFDKASFIELYNANLLKFSNDKVALVEESDALHISGKNKNMQGGRLTICEMFDFGDASVGSMRFDAISQKGKKIIAKFYMDGSSEPFAEYKLPLQKTKDDWSQNGDNIIKLPETAFTGKHYVEVEFYDGDTSADNKTEVAIKSIQFFKNTGIPVLDINIDEAYDAPISDMNEDIMHMTECYGKINITVPEGFKSGYSDEGLTEYSGGEYKLDYIRGRGNSTWEADKKPYKIKLENEANLFGMGSNKHWVLVANYYDNSLIRNRITYYLGEKLGMEYTPQLVPVDVNMNGKYLGSYYLCEQIRVGNSRVDINDLEKIKSDSDDITGGYLLGMSPYPDSTKHKISTKHGMSFEIESPEELSSDKVSADKLNEMNSYIEDYINKTEEAIFGEDFKDSEGKSYTEYMDLDSAVKYFLIQAYSDNGDAYGTPSTYLYKKKDGKLYWGPLWDFDYVAWGSTDYAENPMCFADFDSSCEWFERLINDEQFRKKIYEVWGGKDSQDPSTLGYQINELVKEGGVLDQYEAELTSSAENNFSKWGFTDFGYNSMQTDGVILDEDGREITIPDSFVEEGVYGPYANADNITQCETYHEEIERLRRWINNRTEWIDEYINEFEATKQKTVRFYDGDKLIDEVKIYSGRIFDFPEKPTKDGYIFAGWFGQYKYTDEELDEGYEDEGEICITEHTNINKDIDVYAKWISADEVVPIEKIHVIEKEIYMEKNDYSFVSYSLLPQNAYDDGIEMISTDPNVVEIIDENGFYGVEEGDCEVKIKAKNGVEETVLVHVVASGLLDYERYCFTASENNVEMNVGESKIIDFSIDPQMRRVISLNVSNLNSEIAEMDFAGVITAHSPGNTIIAARVAGCEELAIINVTVKDTEQKADSDKKDEKTSQDDQKKADDNVQKPADSSSKPENVTDKKTNEAKAPDSKTSEQKNIEPKPAEQQVTQQPTTEKKAEKADNKKTTKKIDKLKKGTTFESGNLKYEVVKSGSLKKGKVTGGKVKVIGISSKGQKSDSIVVPASVSYKKNTFKITEISSKAFTGNEKIKTAVIGKNVTKVGKCAFSDCTKLKKVTINGKNAKFSKKAFKDTDKELKVYVPAAKIKTYKKRLAKIGVAKNKVVKKEK